MSKHCSRANKARYASRLEADLAIASIHGVNDRHRYRKYREEPKRSYRCEFCAGWHITKQTQGALD